MKITKDRLLEPTNFAGLGLILAGLGQVLKIDEAGVIAQTVTDAGQAVASGNWSAALMIIAGAAAVLLREKGYAK